MLRKRYTSHSHRILKKIRVFMQKHNKIWQWYPRKTVRYKIYSHYFLTFLQHHLQMFFKWYIELLFHWISHFWTSCSGSSGTPPHWRQELEPCTESANSLYFLVRSLESSSRQTRSWGSEWDVAIVLVEEVSVAPKPPNEDLGQASHVSQNQQTMLKLCKYKWWKW